MDHSFEEIRAVALDLLASRETGSYGVSQYESLLTAIGEVFTKREGPKPQQVRYFSGDASLSPADKETFLEVFWGLFREGIITLGMNDSNREFPWFRVSAFGQRVLTNQQTYFFHDVSSYEALLSKEVPGIDPTTLLYLKEAMQAFRVGAILASTVMLGVATEHTFLLTLETALNNSAHAALFAKADKERSILPKVNAFKAVLDAQGKQVPQTIREDLDTHFAGILSIIRNFRNQSGHPTGKIIDREQCYILLQLFIPYCKKLYQIKGHYK